MIEALWNGENEANHEKHCSKDELCKTGRLHACTDPSKDVQCITIRFRNTKNQECLSKNTLPETNIAPENSPSQKETSIPTIHFQGLC